MDSEMRLIGHKFTWPLVTASVIFLLVARTLSIPAVNSSLPIPHDIPLGCLSEGTSKVCFFFYNHSVSWEEARKDCSNDDRNLAKISSSERDDKIRQNLKEYASNLNHESPGYKVWTSGHSSPDLSWKWIDGQPINEKHTPFTSTPKDYQNCAAVESPINEKNTDIRITGRHCRSVLHLLCQQKQSATNMTKGDSCKIGSHKGLFLKDRCVVPYGNDPQNFRQGWRKAIESCEAIRASLATLEGLSGDEILLILNYQPEVFWIGLTNLDWMWVEQKLDEKLTGSPLNYSSWFLNPSPAVNHATNCLAAGHYHRGRYGWTDERCTDLLPFICQQVGDPIVESSGNSTTNGGSDSECHNELHDWANIIIPSGMVALIGMAAVLSVICHYQQKRKDYKPEK